MPEREEILDKCKTLPTISTGTVANDDEVWDTYQKEAHFIFTKEVFPMPLHLSVFSLSVSGPLQDRQEVVADFKSVLGQEMEKDYQSIPLPVMPDYGIDYIIWDIKAVNKRN